MLNNKNSYIERIIAKINNDFNIDSSDYIPRIIAWTIEAMQQLNVIPTKRICKQLKVIDRIAYSECTFMNKNIKVFDSNGCELTETSEVSSCCGSPSTGGLRGQSPSITIAADISDTVDIINNSNPAEGSDYVMANTINSKDYNHRYNVIGYKYGNHIEKHYTIIDDNKIEVNFDTDHIIVEYDSIITYYSKLYQCELPVIPNNGLLVEAIGYYCMYKILCRGIKHPVFNLSASQYGTNPYYMWETMKEKAKRSVIIANQDNNDNSKNLWQNAFYFYTFNPRD